MTQLSTQEKSFYSEHSASSDLTPGEDAWEPGHRGKGFLHGDEIFTWVTDDEAYPSTSPFGSIPIQYRTAPIDE